MYYKKGLYWNKQNNDIMNQKKRENINLEIKNLKKGPIYKKII